MRIWPFAQLNEWADRKRGSREVRVVATCEMTTTFVDTECKPTGLTAAHVVEFLMDGNGLRSSTTRTTDAHALDDHKGVLNARYRWRVHGALPEDAWRVDNHPRGKLVAISGGKGAA